MDWMLLFQPLVSASTNTIVEGSTCLTPRLLSIDVSSFRPLFVLSTLSIADYLTNHQLNGYDISSCRNYCTSDPGNCQSFNIFREFGTTSSSDPVYKCSLFSQRHTAADATNKGGQDQGYGQLTRIEWSQIQQRGSAYSVTNLKGAIDANAAGGYLGTSDIGYAYDPSACANACDKTSGECGCFIKREGRKRK